MDRKGEKTAHCSYVVRYDTKRGQRAYCGALVECASYEERDRDRLLGSMTKTIEDYLDRRLKGEEDGIFIGIYQGKDIE